MTTRFAAIIIGTGQSGPAPAARLSAMGMSVAIIMYAKAPYTVITRAVHIHPTVSELVPTMLGELRPLA